MLAIDGSSLRKRGERTFGKPWRERLAKAVGVTRQAVMRWENSGVTGDRAMQVDTVLAVVRGQTLTERFSEWRQARFAHVLHASQALGIDKDTINAAETGITKNGNAYAPPRWLEFVMLGYDQANKVNNEKLTAPAEKSLLRDAQSGKFNYTELQAKYSIGQTTLYNILAENGIRMTQGGKKPTGPITFDAEALTKHLIETQSLSETAKKFGITNATIIYHQKRGIIPLTEKQKIRAEKRRTRKSAKLPRNASTQAS